MKNSLFVYLLLANPAYLLASESETQLETITVTAPVPENLESTSAFRTPTKKTEIPYSVDTINNTLLQDNQIRRLEDTALFAPGVQQGSNQSGLDTELIIRGFPTAGATYLNGMLDNRNYQTRDMALVEQIDILKGHSSVLYGSSSPGGTVNYISKKPQAEAKHSLQFTAGNYDFYRLVADSTGTVSGNKNLLYRVITVGQLANSFRQNVRQDKATFAPSLSWQYATQGKLDLDFEYQYENQPFRFDNVYTQGQVVYDRSYVDPRAKSDRHHWRVSSKLTQELIKDWNLVLSGQYFHTERHDLLVGFYTFANDTSVSNYYRDVHDHYNQLNLRGEMQGKLSLFGTEHQLIVGAERNHSHDYLNSQRNVKSILLDIYQPSFNYTLPTNFSALNTDLSTLEYGYYLHDKIDIADLFHIFSGFRYSTFKAHGLQNNTIVNQPTQDVAVYNAGLSFTPISNFELYYGYNESFQPNYGADRYGKTLSPKRGTLHEIGMKGNLFNKKLNFSTALYHLKQHNLLTPDPVDRDYNTTMGEIVSHGLEADLSAQVTDQLELRAIYSWIEAEFGKHTKQQGNTLRSPPKHSGTFRAKYQLPFNLFSANDKLSFGGNLVFVDKRFGDDANSFQVAGYIRPDLFFHYQLSNIDLRLTIENLLDKRYVSASIFDDTVVQGNRRLVQGSVNLRF